jgi:hypothetical protein
MLYVKSSAIVLLPSMTKGNQLDGLRQEMEAIEDSTGKPVRVAYSSAVKVGNKQSPSIIWNENGDFIPNVVKNAVLDSEGKLNTTDTSKYDVVTTRNLKIQQKNPFKSEKTNEQDTITAAGQPSKMLFSGEVLKALEGEEVMYNGKPTKILDLLDIYDGEFKKIAERRINNFNNNYGTDSITKIKNTQELIHKQAKDRNFTERDVYALDLIVEYRNELGEELEKPVNEISDTENITILNINFRVPAWLKSNFGKIDSTLNATINNEILKLKFPGYSHILTSATGITKGWIQNTETGEITDKEGNKAPSSSILFTSPRNKTNPNKLGYNLIDKDGSIYSEIFVPSKFKDKDGKLIDLTRDKRFHTEDGYLNLDMLSEDLLYSIGFRIPFSDNNLGARFKIAGFLPLEFGDGVVMPEEFILQMGIDFDIDKQNFYNQKYYHTKTGGFKNN